MSTESPRWWRQMDEGDGHFKTQLITALCDAAEVSLPNEVCGMIVVRPGFTREHGRVGIEHGSHQMGQRNPSTALSPGSRLSPHPLGLCLLPGVATPERVAADPHAVVDFAYGIKASGAHVLATFHSHPGGETRFSQSDEQLRLWANDHVVAVRFNQSWQFFFQSNPAV